MIVSQVRSTCYQVVSASGLSCVLLLSVLRPTLMRNSMLLGVGLWFIPNLYAAYQIFGRMHKLSARQLLTLFYYSECIKLLLIGVIFVIMLRSCWVIVPDLILGYGITQIIFCCIFARWSNR